MEEYGLLAQGDVTGAAKANLAGKLGIVAGSTPAQLLKAGMQSTNPWVRTILAVKPEFQLTAALLAKAETYGKSLDAAQFERGADSAALVEQLVMLPLDRS